MPVQPDQQDSTHNSPATGTPPKLRIVSAEKLPAPTRVHVRHEIATTVSCGHASYQTVVDAVLAKLASDPRIQARMADKRAKLREKIKSLKYAIQNGATYQSKEHAQFDLDVKRTELDDLDTTWLPELAASIVDELIEKGLLAVSRDKVHACSELFAVAS